MFFCASSSGKTCFHRTNEDLGNFDKIIICLIIPLPCIFVPVHGMLVKLYEVKFD